MIHLMLKSIRIASKFGDVKHETYTLSTIRLPLQSTHEHTLPALYSINMHSKRKKFLQKNKLARGGISQINCVTVKSHYHRTHGYFTFLHG